jgi:hypothetical protein
MKKLLIIFTLVLVLALSGCRSDEEPKMSIEGWARHYAIQQYEEDYNYTAFASQVEELDIIPEVLVEVLVWDYVDVSYAYFKVTVFSDEGSETPYLLFILYEDPLFLIHFFEEKIIDVDIERVKEL